MKTTDKRQFPYLANPESDQLADIKGSLRDLKALLAENRKDDVMRRIRFLCDAYVRDDP